MTTQMQPRQDHDAIELGSFEVDQSIIRATGPALQLPTGCVGCGRDDVPGARDPIDRRLIHIPLWVWPTLFIHWGLTVGLILICGKRLTIYHNLCEDCRKRRRVRNALAAGSWMIFAAGFTTLGLDLFVSSLPAFGGALVMGLLSLHLTWLARYPLKLIGHRKGNFSITGAHPRYLLSIGTGPPRNSRSQPAALPAQRNTIAPPSRSVTGSGE